MHVLTLSAEFLLVSWHNMQLKSTLNLSSEMNIDVSI